MKKHYKVSIIIPIYKVEPFIERCAIALLNQDFDSIEYIFINDATPDNSFKILKVNLSEENLLPSLFPDLLHN